jgi:hypothetical protein
MPLVSKSEHELEIARSVPHPVLAPSTPEAQDGLEIEQDADEAIANVAEAEKAVSVARSRATKVLAALERAHTRITDKLGLPSPFRPLAQSNEVK